MTRKKWHVIQFNQEVKCFKMVMGILYFAKNMGKDISKKLSSKYSHNLLDYAKQSAIDAFNTASKRSIQKTAEATGFLIGNKIADKITQASRKKGIYPEKCSKLLIILDYFNNIII